MSRDGRRRVLTYEERVLWSSVTQSMTPLRSDEAAGEPVADEAIAPEPRKPSPKSKGSVPHTDTPIAPAAPKPVPIAPPLSRRAKRNVARGKHEIDARLDLHGLTQDEAHHDLLRFLRTASMRGARLVLVITGKGKRKGHGDGHDPFGRERGVLRRQVPHWLSLPEFRDYVIGFEDAHIAHGGEGALYVRIRRSQS